MKDKNKKFSGMAVTSFIFGLGFWIPLLNFILGGLAIYMGIRSMILIRNNPGKYRGKVLAILGIIFGALVYFTYIVGAGMCLYGYKTICSNIGLSFLTR